MRPNRSSLKSDRGRDAGYPAPPAQIPAYVCLIPQIFNANRTRCPLDTYPTLMAIFDNCMTLPAFDQAQPAKQPDIVPE